MISLRVTRPYQAEKRSKLRLNQSPAEWSTRRKPPAGASPLGFSSSAASAGERVSDSSSEMTVALEMVTANWR